MSAKGTRKGTKIQSSYEVVSSFVFYILLFLLFYPPFFQGLFFQRELQPTHIFTAVVFLGYFLLTGKSDDYRQFNWVELGALGLVLAYIISTIIGVDKSLSIQETLKNINYLLILLLSRRLINNEQKIKTALITLVCAAVVVVIIGIGTALGTFSYNGAFVGGMISSTFQYHNTFGTYCLAMLFLVYRLAEQLEGKRKYLASIASFIIFTGFILSYSRGAWVLLPVVGLLHYMFVPIQYKKNMIAQFLGNLIGFLVIVKNLTAVFEVSNKSLGWIWMLGGILVSQVIAILVDKLFQKIDIKDVIYNLFIPITAILVPLIGLLSKDVWIQFLPETLAVRIATISFGTGTVTERTVFYKDAFKIIKDYPVFGAGGGGWQTLYKAYQSYGYNSTQAHNYYMQLWIEIGTIGILIFASILLCYLYHSYKACRLTTDQTNKANMVSIFSAVSVILLHSIIDFDLSLGAMSIILWGLIGMQLAIKQMDIPSNMKIGRIPSYAIAVLAAFLLFGGFANNIAQSAAGKGVYLAQQNQPEQAMQEFKTAVAMNPFESSYLADYANIMNIIALTKQDKTVVQQSIETMDKVVERSKYDFRIISNAARFYLRNQQIDKALETINMLEIYNPLNSDTYVNKSSLYVTIAEYYIKEGNKEKAKELLIAVSQIENHINELNEQIKNSVKVNEMVIFIELRTKTCENIEKARELLNSITT